MKFILFIYINIILFLLFSSNSLGATATAETVIGIPNTVDVRITFTGFNHIVSVTHSLTVDTTKLKNPRIVNENTLTLNGDIPWECFDTLNVIKIIWVSKNLSPITLPDNTPVYTLRFDYTGGSSPVNFNVFECDLTDSTAAPVFCNYINGLVTQGVNFATAIADTVIVTGIPDSVDVPIKYTGFNNIVSITHSITVDTTKLKNPRIVNEDSLTLNGDIAWVCHDTLNIIKILWVSKNQTPITLPDTTPVYTLRFDYTGGTSPVNFNVLECDLTDVNENSVPCNYINGLVIQVLDTLSAPILISPAKDTTEVPIKPTFKWHTVTRATSYTIQVSLLSDFSTTVISQNIIGDTTYTPTSSLTDCSQYYWRVNAKNPTQTSQWSIVWDFRTLGVLSAPTLESPINGKTGVSVTPTFTWAAATGATSYTLAYATNSNFSGATTVPLGNVLTYALTTPLICNTQYWWHIKATNSCGTSDWSSVRNFTTLGTPPQPSPVSPVNGDTLTKFKPTFIWNTSTGATSYTLAYSTNSNFNNSIIIPSINDTSYTLNNNLSDSTQYWWHVSANNLCGTSVWSNSWSFKIIITSIFSESVTGINLTVIPNPASNKAYISFNLATDANVLLSVTNSLGIEVARLVDSEINAGNHQVEFNTELLSSGMYYCTLRTGESNETIKIIIMK